MTPEPAADEAVPIGEATVAPLADLLFSVATVVVALLVAVLPALVAVPSGAAARRAEIDALAATADAGLVLVAGRDGVTVAAAGRSAEARTVPLARLLDDATLAAALAAAARAPGPVGVIVEPDGGEAAFVLEGLLAAAGVAVVAALRLPGQAP